MFSVLGLLRDGFPLCTSHDPSWVPQLVEALVEVPIRRSGRQRRPKILNDYYVYLREHDYGIGHKADPVTFQDAIYYAQSSMGIDAMKVKM